MIIDIPQVRPHPVIHPFPPGLPVDGMVAGLMLVPPMLLEAVTTLMSLGVNPAPWS